MTDVILTPEQRVRVFISSTLEELTAERAAARRAIRRLDLVPVWFKSGARPHPPRGMYRAYLEQSQVFVGIYWQRYGWVAPGMEISGLEDEYRLAAGKPKLLYLKCPAPSQEPRLTAMIDSIRAGGTVSCRAFATPKELERLLAEDLAVLLSESFAGAGAGVAALGVSPAGPGEPGEADLPAGTVTFLLTDIEGSTRLWETVPEAMEAALERHNRLLTGVIEGHGGVVVTSRGEGDSFFAVFPGAVAAVEAAGACQLRLGTEAWPAGAALRVRMGLHTGDAHVQEGDYVDHAPINRCARVKAAAHGGQVLVTKATHDLAGGRLGGGFGLKRLGEFRLRDLAEPELIYQLIHADLPADFPPIVTAAERTGNLPVPVSSFIGRARELEQTAATLSGARVVTLTGPGGVGKTRLALQAAAQVAPRFADGTWLAELATVRDPAGVDDAVAAVFPVTAQPGQTAREALMEFLRTKDLLLVLDNCEHLIEAAAGLAVALARSCERLVILATSREALGIDGERLVPVPPLAVPGAEADLAAITQAEAVRLFADRAAAVKPSFQLTAENAAAVAAVVRRLDGIALAIELAAARVPAMTAAELARRLERSFGVLAAGPRGAAAHHQTLRATIDWSFQLLTGPEQVLMARLAVFAGGATVEAVEAVCGGEGIDPDAIFELLAGLIARSLVVAEEEGLETRYRLLETIRQYGEECLSRAGETERWRARHAGYYADLLGRIRDHAHDRNQEVFWAVLLGAEQDNLLAAWSWVIGAGNVDTAFQILAGFAPCEIWTTYPLKLAGEAAVGLPGAAEHRGYPLALAVSALFASIRADAASAEELGRRAAEANARCDTPDWRVEATILAARSNIAAASGAFADAARLAEQAAGLSQAGGDLADASVELAGAVAYHVLAGDAPRGVPLAREALVLARKVGAPALIATAVVEVGATIAGTDPEQARAHLRESLELSTALGYQSARDLVWAAGIASALNDRTTTLELARSAIRGLQWSGDRLRMGMTLHTIAGTLAATRPEAAAIILGAAEAHALESARTAQLINSTVIAALGKQRTRELCARGADMDWDQAVDYTLTQTTQALSELQSAAQPGAAALAASFQLTRRFSMAEEGRATMDADTAGELQVADPRSLGQFRLLGRLGTGGMGQVFLGSSAGGRPVAVKVIRPELAVEPGFRSRFAREVTAARKVSGLFTALVVDADVDGPVPWLATAYVAGPSLANAVEVHGPLPEASVLTLAAGLAEGLEAIHAAGVVHRDLKPSNVLLAADGPRVIDFGISRAVEATALTQSGMVMGSPGFMSPEQAEGGTVGPPSDVFSLGAVLAFAATGENPFGTGPTPALIYRVIHQDPNTDGLPGSIRPLVERYLAKDPSLRPTSSALLAELGPGQLALDWLPASLTEALGRHGVPPHPPTTLDPPPAARRPPQRRPPGRRPNDPPRNRSR